MDTDYGDGQALRRVDAERRAATSPGNEVSGRRLGLDAIEGEAVVDQFTQGLAAPGRGLLQSLVTLIRERDG